LFGSVRSDSSMAEMNGIKRAAEQCYFLSKHKNLTGKLCVFVKFFRNVNHCIYGGKNFNERKEHSNCNHKHITLAFCHDSYAVYTVT